MDFGVFNERHELVSSIKQYFLSRGVSVVLHKNSDHRRAIFKCYHGGAYRNPLKLTAESRQRMGASRLMGCPFKIVARPLMTGWTVVSVNDTHNHSLPANIGGYSTARKLSEYEKPVVRALVEAGSSTSTILSYLRNECCNQWTTRTAINNEKAMARKEFLAGRSSIQALFDIISGGDFIYDFKVDENGSVNGLFFTHKSSASLARRFSNTFVMDCTYKTNRFGMPLLNIVGITATFRSFNAGFAFIPDETEKEYVWALKAFSVVVVPTVVVTDRELSLMKALTTVFPSAHNLLCVWHVNKNVLANCKKFEWDANTFDDFMSDWNQVLNSNGIELFHLIWDAFIEKWSRSHVAAVEYLERIWLIHKEKIVRCWTNQYLHFGTTSTSRGEGNHFVVKRYLKIANGDMLMVLNNLERLLQTQFTDLNAASESEKLVIAHRHNLPFMHPLVKNISQFALDKMLRQHQEISPASYDEECTGMFRKTYGIPCKHEIRVKILEGGQFSIGDFHPQWHLMDNPLFHIDQTVSNVPTLSPRRKELQLLREMLYAIDDDQVPTLLARLKETRDAPADAISNPLPSTRKRGRPAGPTNRANQRDRSQFEYATGNKCGNCGKNGHNARTCKE
jgi:hypothetical protein